MSENEIRNYETSVAHFGELTVNDSADEHLSRLLDVQSHGLIEGIAQQTLLPVLEGMARVGRERAELGAPEMVDRFSLMEKGYKLAYENITKTGDAGKNVRSRRDVAAG